MSTSPPGRGHAVRSAAPGLAVLLSLAVGGCFAADPIPSDTPTPIPSPSASPSPTPSPTATPSPTPLPTPTYTNQPDAALSELIPGTVGSVTLVKPAPTEFAITPGDVGAAFGEIGLHFRTLVIGYVAAPRTSLYAMRLDQPVATTRDLQPQLAEIGRYVGIAGLDAEPWRLVVVADHEVWTRTGDRAVLRATTLYTWLTDEYAFLLIGADDALNRAIVARLPGEPAATPTPAPISSPPASPL